MTAIIILNWNGWKDTIECLESIKKASGKYCILVVDNGSDDDSVFQISNYIENNSNINIELLQTNENLGFAKGNNVGIKYATTKWNADSYLLLNNDTLVEIDFLDTLNDFSNSYPEYKAITPLICYNSNRELIWNCGGWQRCGIRKYYFADSQLTDIRGKLIKHGHGYDYINVSFLTGCALYFKADILDKDNRIFTEDFFFGEEDFNFCLRMNNAHNKMACLLSSKIYHKVSVSTSSKNKIGKIYIHYLNRYIDIRKNSKYTFYLFWSCIHTLYVLLLLIKENYGVIASCKTILKVLKNAHKKKTVTKKDFYDALEA